MRNASSQADNVLNESEDTPMSEAFENISAQNIHLGTQSEITDLSVEPTIGGTSSEITDMSKITLNSETLLARTPISRRSRSSRRTTFSLNTGFINPAGTFSQNLKDRARFVLELFKLNYRMLISLTLTLFVAIFVCLPSLMSLMVDLCQFTFISEINL